MKIFSRLAIAVALVSSFLLLACNGQNYAGYWLSGNNQEACIIQHIDDKWYSIEIVTLKGAKRAFLPGTGKIRAQYKDGTLHFKFFFADCIARIVSGGNLAIITPQGSQCVFARSSAEEVEALRPRRR